jgi:DNA-binding phage protein
MGVLFWLLIEVGRSLTAPPSHTTEHTGHASGLAREALYKALRPNSQPRFDTIARVCTALGIKLVAQVAHT